MTTTIARQTMGLTREGLEQRNTEFAELVEELAGGRSNRTLRELTGVNPTTIGDMRWGIVPVYRTLERFADGLRLEPRTRYTLFSRARYVMNEGTPEERYLSWLRSIQQRYGRTPEIYLTNGGAGLTHEDLDKLIPRWERRIEQEGWEPIEGGET
jgi:hypothetical protein